MIGRFIIISVLAACTIAAPSSSLLDESHPQDWFEGVKTQNDRPIIGIMAMEVSATPLAKYYSNYTSHIVASYVKWLEGAGARVVPIMVHKKPSYYMDIIKKVNGILIPGGPTSNRPEEYESEMLRAARDTANAIGAHRSAKNEKFLPFLPPFLPDGTGYGAGAAILLALAKNLNDAGYYMPVWGTCLGFQLMTLFSGQTTADGLGDFRQRCEADNLIVPTTFTTVSKSSRLFKNAPNDVMKILQKESVTAHYHGYCLTEDALKRRNISSAWNVLSTNKDFKGMDFISTTEAKYYPFYGVQYHPEKVGFEWNTYEQSPHDPSAVLIMQYMGNFLVNEARKSSNAFADLAEERAALIYNYQPTYTGDKSVYEQVYFFE